MSDLRCNAYVPAAISQDGFVLLAGATCNAELVPFGPNMICLYGDDHIEHLKQISGRASCGCVHHAEEGFPCQHDLELDKRLKVGEHVEFTVTVEF